MKEALGNALALHEPHRSRIAVRHDRFRRASGDFTEAAANLVKRLAPADRHEAPFALRTDALERDSEAIGMVNAIRVATDFRAQHALRRRMVGVAAFGGLGTGRSSARIAYPSVSRQRPERSR